MAGPIMPVTIIHGPGISDGMIHGISVRHGHGHGAGALHGHGVGIGGPVGAGAVRHGAGAVPDIIPVGADPTALGVPVAIVLCVRV